jgi:DNA-directed RNA polymerase subunit RPC12/RpoP
MRKKFQYDEAIEEKIRQLYASGKPYLDIQWELGISEMDMFEYIGVITKKDDAIASRNSGKVISPYASKPRSCPSCGHRPVATILYGYPAESEVIEHKVAAGLIAYGGCRPQPAPRWKCTECGQKIFSSKP